MPFCPECRDEFEDWVEECPDCHVRLVATLPEPLPEPEPRYIDEPLVTVASFAFPLQAHVFRTKLESEGIASFVLNENISRAYSHYLYATGGVLLQVRESDAATAREILGDTPELISDQDDITEEEVEAEEAKNECCPKCNLVIPDDMGSRNRTAFFLRPFRKKKRKCPYCGFEW